MPKKKRHKSRQKYTDEGGTDDDDIELTEENDEYSSEEEIVRVYENRKQRAQRITKETINQIKKEPKCRTICFRYFLFVVVLTTGIAMIVQLYSTYGEYVTDAIFPPRTSSTGRICQNGSLTNDYMLKWHRFQYEYNESGWATLNATKPKESLTFAWTETSYSGNPVLVSTKWLSNDQIQVHIPARNECVSLIVYSI